MSMDAGLPAAAHEDRSWLRRLAERHFHVYIIERETIGWGLARHAGDVRGRVIDVGCGKKPYRDRFPHATEFHGIDWTTEGEADVRASVLELPYRSGAFDGAISSQVLEHVRDPKRMLREIHRILKPGGKLLIFVPMTWTEHESPHDYFRFTRHGLEYLLQDTGFRIDHLGKRGGLFRMVGQRIAPWLYHNLGQTRLRRIVILPLVALIQQIARAVDDVTQQPGDTLGYWALATKPADASSSP